MTDLPNSATVAGLASWLTTHMSRTGRSPEAVAKDLGVNAETVHFWLAGRRPTDDANEFAYLDTPVKLGEWLRARIAESGCSVRQIVESTEGVSMSTVYNWMRGEHLPRPPTGDELDRFDLLLSNPILGLSLRQRLQLDEIRRRLTGTSLRPAEPVADWPTRGLTADNRMFTGRNAELRRLDRLLGRHTRGRAVVISALTGTGGVGKTALAVHWARSRPVRTTFTDGCLYLNLNGYADTAPTSSDTALTKLLLLLEVDPQEIPDDTDAKAARYQEILSSRKLLILLDNAHAEPQVRPLLPTEANCLAVITSRNRLDGLRATHPGIAYLPLDTLNPAEAAALLRNLLGSLVTRSASDAELDALAQAGGYLPLALHIAAANYLTHHSRYSSIGAYAESLAQDRLTRLTSGPTDPTTSVATALDHSYRHLTDTAKRMYRLLGLHPGPDFAAPLCASLTALDLGEAEAALTELAQANLLDETKGARFAFHDLVRDHAAALAAEVDNETGRREAVGRMLDHYVHTAHAATLLLDPGIPEIDIPLSGPAPGVTSQPLADREAALTWFEAEHTAVIAAGVQAAGEWDVHLWQLSWSLHQFLSLRDRMHELVAVQLAALAAAQRLGDAAAQARSHRILAWVDIKLGNFEDSRSHLKKALELSTVADDRVGQAAVHRHLGHLAHLCGESVIALDHAREALALCRSAGDRFGEARALNSVGWYHAQLGDYAEGLDRCEQALGLCRELDYRALEPNVWDSLGYIHNGLGDHHEACTHYERALDLFRKLGDRFSEAETLSYMGDNHHASGDADAAREAWQEALEIFADFEYAYAENVRAKLAGLDADTSDGT